MVHLVAGVSVLGLLVSACNKQSNTPETGTPTVAPPIAALPLVAGPAPTAAAAPAPMVTALPPPRTQIRYAPPPRRDRYRYIDRAYSMGQAFADTPPDYAVDYEGTRPWIWRAGDGAYRIIERLPRGERIYYYDAGQDYPFLVRDPDYSYAYDGDGLAGVYGPDGAEIDDAIAAQRAYEASRYLDRARALYRAAQYERRQSAYANEWAARRDQLRSDDVIWEQQQGRNADWRAWHDQHQSEEAQQWQQERNQRIAYASAIGLAVAAVAGRSAINNTPRPAADPAEVARRQAAYFASWNAAHGRGAAGSTATAQGNTGGTTTVSTPPARVNHPAPQTQQATVVQPPKPGPVVQPKPAPVVQARSVPVAPTQQSTPGARQAAAAQAAATQAAVNAKQREAAAAQAKATQAAQVQKSAAEAKQREAALAQAKAKQAEQAQKLASEAKQREAAAAQTRATQAAQAQKLAGEAKQREAAAAQAKAAQADQVRKQASEAKQREAAAAQARAAQAEKSAAEAKQRQAAAEARAAQAAQAQKLAGEARQREAAAAQAKASQAAQAEKLAAQARQREAAAAQAKAAETAHAQQAADEAKHQKAAAAAASPAKPAANASKRKGEPPKDQPTPQQQ